MKEAAAMTSVPSIKPKLSDSRSIAKYGMWLCCAVMLAPVALYFVQGGTFAGLSSGLSVFAPLVLCVGLHLVMHRALGRSCHGPARHTAPEQEHSPPESTGRVLTER